MALPPGPFTSMGLWDERAESKGPTLTSVREEEGEWEEDREGAGTVRRVTSLPGHTMLTQQSAPCRTHKF